MLSQRWNGKKRLRFLAPLYPQSIIRKGYANDKSFFEIESDRLALSEMLCFFANNILDGFKEVGFEIII